MKYRKRQSKAVIRDTKLALTAEELFDKQAEFAKAIAAEANAAAGLGAAENTLPKTENTAVTLTETGKELSHSQAVFAKNSEELAEFSNTTLEETLQEALEAFAAESVDESLEVLPVAEELEHANAATAITDTVTAQADLAQIEEAAVAVDGESATTDEAAVRQADINPAALEKQVRVSKLRNMLLRDVEAQDKAAMAEKQRKAKQEKTASAAIKSLEAASDAQAANATDSKFYDPSLANSAAELTTSNLTPGESVNDLAALPANQAEIRKLTVRTVANGDSLPTINGEATKRRHSGSTRPLTSYQVRRQAAGSAVLNRDFAKQRREAQLPLDKIIMPDSPKYELPENYVDFDQEKVAVPSRVDVHEDKKSNKFLTELLSLLKTLLVAMLISFLFVTFIAQRNIVDGSSMYPTLHDGDNLIVEKVTNYFSIPEQGTIITFIKPKVQIIADGQLENGQVRYRVEPNPNLPDTQLVKRVIGMPGDEVEIKDNRVYVNGVELLEPYLAKEVVTEVQVPEYAHVKLAEDEIYVLGDNRPHSSDSRSFGPVKVKNLVGRSLVRFYPFNRAGIPR